MKFPTRKKAVLLLQDGTVFEGFSMGKQGTSGGEICFNTGMTGYQEVYTDPSYYGQIIVNTTAHIGNYGTHDEEMESDAPKIKGLVVNSFSNDFSRKTASESLQGYLEKNNTVGIAGLDTRRIVRHIRKRGAMNAIISSERSVADLKAEMNRIPNMEALELAGKVTTSRAYERGQGNTGEKIAVLDIGVKTSILTHFETGNCKLKVFPAHTSFSEMKEWKPDGYFLSNGPGDPSAMDYAIHTVKEMLGAHVPVFGICLGHQLLAKSVGIDTFKMHHGHRGLNHPVKNLNTGLSEMTSQNHGFAVDMDALKRSREAEPTHLNLNDHTVEGLRITGKPAFSVQYHPESSPGPHDSTYLFDDFIRLIKDHKQ